MAWKKNDSVAAWVFARVNGWVENDAEWVGK